MRQNLISDLEGLPPSDVLEELDMYDNRLDVIARLERYTGLKYRSDYDYESDYYQQESGLVVQCDSQD